MNTTLGRDGKIVLVFVDGWIILVIEMNAQTFTVTDLEKMVAEHEAAAIRVKTIINELCVKGGLPPRYPASELQQSSGGVFSIRSDLFHGRPLATCVREFLEMRRRSDLGPASTNEIYDALAQGGYEFGGKTEQIARTSMYNSVNKNPVFYKLPNKKWGLREWYPTAKHQTQDDEDESSLKDVRAHTEKETAEKSGSVKSLGRNVKASSAVTHIEQVLSSDKNKEWNVDEILAKVPNVKKTSLNSLLFRLRRENKAQKVGRGLWKAKI